MNFCWSEGMFSDVGLICLCYLDNRIVSVLDFDFYHFWEVYLFKHRKYKKKKKKEDAFVPRRLLYDTAFHRRHFH